MAPSLPKPEEFRQEHRLGLVVYGGVSLAIYMNGVCREFYNAVRGRGIYKLIKALTDSDIIVDVISGTSAGGINGVLLSYALTNSSKEVAVDFENFAEIWRESGDINRLLRQPNPKQEINSVLDGEGYYQDRLAEAFHKAWEKRNRDPEKESSEWFSDSSELDLFVTGTDTLGRVYKAFDNTGCVIEVKDHRSVFLLKYRRGRKHPFQPPRNSSAPQSALAKLCRITSCFPVAFPVVTVQLENPELEQITAKELGEILRNPQHPKHQQYFTYAVDKHLVRWGKLGNRELPPEQGTVDGHRLHFVDGGVLDNRPFGYTIREIYYRTAYRPVERKLFYIDPSPDQFLGSAKFTRMAKPTIWETVSDSLVGMPRYESIANDLQEIKERNERVMRYKFLRATAERVGRAKLEAKDKQQRATDEILQPYLDDEILRQQIYLRCRLVGMRDQILPLVLRIDQIGSSSDNPTNQEQNKQALLESAAQLITKYITDKQKQKAREDFLHQLAQEIRNLDVDYALRKHLFLLEKICQLMADPQYQNLTAYPDLNQDLKQLAESISRQVELLQVIQAALAGMLQSEPVSRTFYALINRAQAALADGGTDKSDRQETYQKIRRDTRKDIYDYLLRLHRFLLDADGLTDFVPSRDLQAQANAYAIDQPDENNEGEKHKPVEIPTDFFQHLPSPITSAEISSVLLQLKKKSRLLDFAKLGLQPSTNGTADQLDTKQPESLWQDSKYEYVKGSENDSERYYSILRRVEQASEKLIQSSGAAAVKDELLSSFQSFRYVDQEVYSFEYLSDIRAKEQIEIIRISPDVAQFGLGKGKGLEDKLGGDQLGAFGGFFKKSWRSNDILWGRLDGLNRIVEALLTSSALTNFSSFISRQLGENPAPEQLQQYLDALINEALPEATSPEKARLIQDLTGLAAGQTLKGDALDRFLDLIVSIGHRAILKTDLGNVLEDAIAEQLNWSQQLVPPKNFQKTISGLGYKSPPSRTTQTAQLLSLSNQASSPSNQRMALQYIDSLVASLLSPRARKTLKLQPNQLAVGLETAFPQSPPEDRQKLSELLQAAASTASVDHLANLLKRLLAAGRYEAQQLKPEAEVRNDIVKLNQNLAEVLQKLKPKYEPVTGYFDRAVTPFAAKELAEEAIKKQLADPQQAEAYFRNDYRVGSETVTQDIPTIILEDIAARAGLVVRDIFGSPPTGNRVRKTKLFQIANGLLQTFYLWVQAKKPTSWLPRSLQAWVPLLLLIVAIAGVAYLVSKLPSWLLVLLITLAVLRVFNQAFNRAKTPAWMPWLVAIALVLFVIAGLRFLPDSSSVIKTPFGEMRIFIQNLIR